MISRIQKLSILFVAALVLMSAGSAQAVITQTLTDGNNSGVADTFITEVSAQAPTSIINGNPGTHVNLLANGGGTNGSFLTNGLFAASFWNDGNHRDVGGSHTGGLIGDGPLNVTNDTDGWTSAYSLGGSYDITSIKTYGGWDGTGRPTVIYSVDVDDDPLGLTPTPLTSVNLTGVGGHNRVVITDSHAARIALGVSWIRFNYAAYEPAAWNSEFQVFGTLAAPENNAVPEPSTYALGLIGLAGLGLFAWRKKYRRA